MFNLGPQELFWLFLIVLFVFGAKRIPEIGRSLGKGIREFKGSLAGLADPVDAIRGREPAMAEVESALDARINTTEPVRRLSS